MSIEYSEFRALESRVSLLEAQLKIIMDALDKIGKQLFGEPPWKDEPLGDDADGDDI